MNRWGFAASVIAVVSVGSCAGASSVGDIQRPDTERIDTGSDFGDLVTFCSHGVRVFVGQDDAYASSSVAVYSGPGSADCEPKVATAVPK